ncbi:nucleotide exchange factor GrpE [Candidatus Woesearchaeota archaeon]|nr:nucleotide exchange factor GrpE [Candidatus Woesearchaeota archaeon]
MAEKKQTKTKKTKEQELQEKINDLTDTLQRLQAEFENYQKRMDKEKAEYCRYAKAEMIEALLPILDNFEIALRNKDHKDDFVKGMEMIYAEMITLLQKQGVRPIEAFGKKADPNYHEVLLTERSDKEEGTILEELQKGYMLNEKVLRYSKVKVAKNGDQPKNTSK